MLLQAGSIPNGARLLLGGIASQNCQRLAHLDVGPPNIPVCIEPLLLIRSEACRQKRTYNCILESVWTCRLVRGLGAAPGAEACTCIDAAPASGPARGAASAPGACQCSGPAPVRCMIHVAQRARECCLTSMFARYRQGMSAVRLLDTPANDGLSGCSGCPVGAPAAAVSLVPRWSFICWQRSALTVACSLIIVGMVHAGRSCPTGTVAATGRLCV
jgi:hypothetical protein